MTELGKILTATPPVSTRTVAYATGTVVAWVDGVSNNINVSGGIAGPNLTNVPYLTSVTGISAGDIVAMLVYQGQYLIIGKIKAL